MAEIIAAIEFLRKLLRRRGRPRKYPISKTPGYSIIETVDGVETQRAEGFKTRREAKQHLAKLRAIQKDTKDSDTQNVVGVVHVYRIVSSSPVAERVAALRHRKRKHIKIIATTGAGLGAGQYLSGAPHGKGELVCGGNDSKHISAIYAAHVADLGGMTNYPARRTRPFGCSPDPDDHDRSGDAVDIPSLSLADPDWEREIWEFDDHGRLFIEAAPSASDELSGSSVEDRALPRVIGLDKAEYQLVTGDDGEPKEVLMMGTDILVGGSVMNPSPEDAEDQDETGIPHPLQEYLDENAEKKSSSSMKQLPLSKRRLALDDGSGVRWNAYTTQLEVFHAVPPNDLKISAPAPPLPKSKCNENNSVATLSEPSNLLVA
ncbi:MAG: hypothetical protein ACRD4C_06775 [Candidatus Acidiferrales bacterium]